jgi:hypothetical protein
MFAGDMLPTTPLEVLLSMFFMLCGVSIGARMLLQPSALRCCR